MRLPKLVPILFLLTWSMACNDDQQTPIRYDVPDEVEPFVQKFIEEGKERGVDLVVDNLVVELTSPVENNGQFVCGVTFGPVINLPQNYIEIDTQCLAWRHSEVSREILVFHELGHALLLRPHRTDLLPNFDFASIMVSSTWNIDDFYTFDLTKREYYMDELFDPSTPVPDWGN
ncbi:MAG: hypothetical protein ACPGJS_12530 [Flammeovirgaceae bacterium]